MKPVSRGRLALALVLPCVTLIGAHALFDPLYRTNDDPAMLLLSAGSVFVDEPTPYLVFSNHAWGQLVSTLYTRLPEFPWYRVLQLLVQFAAGATLVYAALGRRLSAARLIPVACCLALFETLATARPHFTLVSAYAAIAAVILVSAGRRDEELGRIRWALFACLWIAAAAIRHESAALVLLLWIPPAAARLVGSWRANGTRRAILRVGLPLGVAALIVASLHGYNRMRYAVPEWRDFIETGSGIGAVLDFSAAGSADLQTWESYADGTFKLVDTRYSPEVFAAAADGPGWTQAEMRMLLEWFYADEELFSVERVESFLQTMGEPKRPPRAWLEPLGRDPDLYVMLVAIGVALAFRRLNRPDAVTWILAAAGAVALLTYVDSNLNRLVGWVYEPVLAYLCWFGLALGEDRPLVSGGRLWLFARALLCGLFLSLLLATGGRLVSTGDATAPTREAYGAAVRDLKSGPETLYVSWAGAFPVEFLGPFDDLGPYRELRFYAVAAATRGGHNRRRLEQFGIDDIHRAIYLDPRLRVISETRHNRTFADFVRERYGAEIVAERTASYSSRVRPLFDVYRFSEAPAGD